MIHLEKAPLLAKTIADKKYVLVDFFATWCGPCRMLAPVLDQLADQDKFEIVKVDVDLFEELTQQHGVSSMPTLIWFVNGEEVNRNSGFLSKDALVELNEEFFN